MDGLPTGWQSQLDGWLAALQQMRIPGGCEDCHAFHTVCTEEEHVSRVTVHHRRLPGAGPAAGACVMTATEYRRVGGRDPPPVSP